TTTEIIRIATSGEVFLRCPHNSFLPRNGADCSVKRDSQTSRTSASLIPLHRRRSTTADGSTTRNNCAHSRPKAHCSFTARKNETGGLVLLAVIEMPRNNEVFPCHS